MKNISKVLFILLASCGLFFSTQAVMAAGTLDTGVTQVNQNINLSNSDPRTIATRIINVSLLFLGIIAVSIILWGGFIWMKSNGNEEQIEKAKKILKSGIIGLIIILSSWGIAYFVITRLWGATNGGGPGSNPDLYCTSGASCFCGGHTVCDSNGNSSCVGYDCTNSTSTPVSCNGGGLGSCQPDKNLCGSNDKFCNDNCLCETKGQNGDSCGKKADGSCDVSANNCGEGTTCNASTCLCEGQPTILGVSPLGGFCASNISKECESDADCPGSSCDTKTPNGRDGSFLTIFGRNFNQPATSQPLLADDFSSYQVQLAPVVSPFSDLQKGDGSEVLIAKNPSGNAPSLFFSQTPGVVDGAGTAASVSYNILNKNLANNHIYQLQFSYQGLLANHLVVYFDGHEIYDLAPGPYSDQRSIFIPFIPKAEDGKVTFSLAAGPTSNGTSLYINNLKVVDATDDENARIGDVVAQNVMLTNPSCAMQFDNQIIVTIPYIVLSGPIKITRGGKSDTTNDDNGPKFNDFQGNFISRPGICGLDPSGVRTNDTMNIFGANFTGAVEPTKAYFGDYQSKMEADSSFSSDSSGRVKIPSLTIGNNSIFLASGKKKSNFLFFQKLNDLPPAPTITAISPASGNTGQYVTISGNNFGNSQGNGHVYFGTKSAGKEAGYDFPAECKNALWSDSQILVKVPSGLSTGASNVEVVNDSWKIDSSSTSLFFNFDSNAVLSPGVCRINPDRGPANSPVTLFGENFGSNGAAAFVLFNALTASSTVQINNKTSQVAVTVPAAAISGVVKLKTAANALSNPVSFQVGACTKNEDCAGGSICCPENTANKGQCVSDASACVGDIKNSVFEWAFSTDVFGTTTSPGSSCLGISQELGGACQTNDTCPNVPGKCSSASGPVQQIVGSACPDGFSYNIQSNLCVSVATCGGPVDSVNNSSCNDKDNESCTDGHCVVPSSCPSGGDLDKGSGECVEMVAPTCECCCSKQNNNADCCAPLKCDGSCGSGVTANNTEFGKCSGCFAAGSNTATRDAACNCAGHNGQFCAVSQSFPTGACVDCATLNASDCLAHADSCCLDAKNQVNGQPVCRGDAGTLISNNKNDSAFGYCAYYNCSATDSSQCDIHATSTGAYSSVSSCSATCATQGPQNTGLDLNCTNPSSTAAAITCDPFICGGLPSSPFSCLDSSGHAVSSTTPSVGGECGVCCCSPGNDASCKAINAKLSCWANRGSCSGAGRGLCCGCSGNADCGNGNDGCGTDNCCHPYPLVWNIAPGDGQSGVCRNAELLITFNQLMNGPSLATNIRLLERHDSGFVCPTSTPKFTPTSTPSGALTASGPLKEGLIAKIYQQTKKIIASIAKIFHKDSALADSSDPSVYCQIPVNVEPSDNYLSGVGTTTSATIKPKAVLDGNADYLILIKGNKATSSPFDGVISADGVSLYYGEGLYYGVNVNGVTFSAFPSHFHTKGDICEIDYTKLSPTNYLFSTAVDNPADNTYGTSSFDSIRDREKVFTASAWSVDNQRLMPVDGYKWTWNFTSQYPAIIATSTIANSTDTQNQIIATVSTSTSDAQSLLYATVKMPSDNSYFGGNGQKTSSQLFVFICANPWPSVNPNGTWSPWQDSALSGTGYNAMSYNYDFYYCRDSGGPGTDDDLPEVTEGQIPTTTGEMICSNDSAITCTATSNNCPTGGSCIPSVLKEYYFFSKN